MKIGIFGTGAYGLALCSILRENNNEVTMWTKFEEEKEMLITNKGNNSLLPGYVLDSSVEITNSILECAKDKDLLIIVIPAPFVTDLCRELNNYTNSETKICIASKGIEQKTGYFVSDIVKKYLNTDKTVVLSGPSFAKDIIDKKPIGLSLATNSIDTKNMVETALSNNYIKLRYTDDIVGVEICGAVKNVIAISSGILEGLGAGDSTKAMLITESVHDIEKIIESLGGNRKTILSYAGIGDLLLTCTSTNSRNYSYGKLIGERKEKDELENYLIDNTVEGYYTTESIYKLLKDKKIEIPIISLIYEIIYNERNPKELLTFLIKKV